MLAIVMHTQANNMIFTDSTDWLCITGKGVPYEIANLTVHLRGNRTGSLKQIAG